MQILYFPGDYAHRRITRSCQIDGKMHFDDALDAPEDNAYCSPLTSHTIVTLREEFTVYRIKYRRSGSFIREGKRIQRYVYEDIL